VRVLAMSYTDRLSVAVFTSNRSARPEETADHFGNSDSTNASQRPGEGAQEIEPVAGW
jgi:hypothetical protein